MPEQGAAILSQVEGLLEQFLEVGYDTPMKEKVGSMLTDIRSGMKELGREIGEEGANAATENQPESEEEAESPSTGPRNLKETRDDATAFLKGRNAESKAEEEGTDEEDDNPRKKKDKAYS